VLLPCPLCGQADATLSLNLADADTVHCAECDEDFSLDLVREFTARWAPMLNWVASMPAAPG
jgi:hypothetical protein